MTEYRYTLTRDLGAPLIDAQACWVMLNPSTADETNDDQTIRQVRAFSSRLYRRLVVVNLFAARATNPADLATIDDPVGPENEETIRNAMRNSARVVFAWGDWLRTHRHLVPEPPDVVEIARSLGHWPICLGLTKHGSPKHPCRLPLSTPFTGCKL